MLRQCWLSASKRTQTSLSNVIRHIYSRVQCKSKQSICRWSCCIRMLSVRHVNKQTVTSPGCIYSQCVLLQYMKLWYGWMYISLFYKQKLVGLFDCTALWMCNLFSNSWFNILIDTFQNLLFQRKNYPLLLFPTAAWNTMPVLSLWLYSLWSGR